MIDPLWYVSSSTTMFTIGYYMFPLMALMYIGMVLMLIELIFTQYIWKVRG